jgi:hypothetical protein
MPALRCGEVVISLNRRRGTPGRLAWLPALNLRATWPCQGGQDRRVATLFLMVGLPGAGKTTRGRRSWPPAHLTIAANGVIANHN